MAFWLRTRLLPVQPLIPDTILYRGRGEEPGRHEVLQHHLRYEATHCLQILKLPVYFTFKIVYDKLIIEIKYRGETKQFVRSLTISILYLI